MIHKKTYHAIERETKSGKLVIEGPVEAQKLAQYKFHEDLISFRPPDEQQEALVEIADLPEGRIIIARQENTVVGYATYVYPDPLERWSEGNMENLIELGAIEVVPEFRGNQVVKIY